MRGTAKILRDRMVKMQAGQFAFFLINQQVLPEMKKAIEELHTSLAVKDVSLPEAKRTLDKLSDQLRAIEEAVELDRIAVAKMGAGLSKFLEEGELQQERMHESAQLATLQQYFEIAAVGSVPFWVDLFKMVDPPIFAQAWRETDPARQAELTEAKRMRETEDDGQ